MMVAKHMIQSVSEVAAKLQCITSLLCILIATHAPTVCLCITHFLSPPLPRNSGWSAANISSRD